MAAFRDVSLGDEDSQSVEKNVSAKQDLREALGVPNENKSNDHVISITGIEERVELQIDW